MIEIIFDNQDGLYFIDNKKIKSSTSFIDGNYLLLFVPYNKNINPHMELLSIKNSSISNLNNFIVAKYSNSQYYLTYNLSNEFQVGQPTPYFQTKLDINESHYITAYYNLNCFYFSIETENEIYSTQTPCKLENIQIKYTKLNEGELIVIRAKAKLQDYIQALIYIDDYYPILNCTCDFIEINNDHILIHDFVIDSFHREIIRKLAFVNNSYKEIDRQFIYHKTPAIISKTIPYLFIEAVFCKDIQQYKNLLSIRLKNVDIESIFGNFIKIVHIEDMYKEGRISLLYKKESQNSIRHFDFTINDNLITDINEFKPEL